MTRTNLPILNLNYEEINLVVNQDAEIITSTFGEVNLYEWKIYEVISSNLILLSDEVNENFSKTIKFNERGDYKLIASARDSESNLWINDVELDITVYNKPTAYFEFDSDINEDTWIGFNGSKSTGLGLNYVWKLDGNILDSNNAVISTFIDSGGYHVMNLTVEQEPVGIAYYESEIYLNSKPTGVLQTSPTTPRVGEDFEIYLNAFDVETDANIEYLKINIIDNKGNERAESRRHKFLLSCGIERTINRLKNNIKISSIHAASRDTFPLANGLSFVLITFLSNFLSQISLAIHPAPLTKNPPKNIKTNI